MFWHCPVPTPPPCSLLILLVAGPSASQMLLLVTGQPPGPQVSHAPPLPDVLYIPASVHWARHHTVD